MTSSLKETLKPQQTTNIMKIVKWLDYEKDHEQSTHIMRVNLSFCSVVGQQAFPVSDRPSDCCSGGERDRPGMEPRPGVCLNVRVCLIKRRSSARQHREQPAYSRPLTSSYRRHLL